MKLITLLFASLATSLSACSDDAVNESQPETPNDEPAVSVDKNVTINAGQTFQTIKGFAASDCWTPAFVGKYWTNNRPMDSPRVSDSRCGVSTWEAEAWNKETRAVSRMSRAVPNRI